MNKDYIKPVLNKEPKEVIVHVGTNDTRHRNSSEIIQELAELHHQITQRCPKTTIVISELTCREDHADLKRKVTEVNSLLRTYCKENKIGLISHRNIDSTSLNGSKLHLNQFGTSKFAKNIISYLRDF